MSTYHAPPEGYTPPERCQACGGAIHLIGVTGGIKWAHVNPGAGHQPTLPAAGWWDSMTGQMQHELLVLRPGM